MSGAERCQAEISALQVTSECDKKGQGRTGKELCAELPLTPWIPQ